MSRISVVEAKRCEDVQVANEAFVVSGSRPVFLLPNQGARSQPNFFSPQIIELGFAKELYHIGYSKYEEAIKGKSSYQAASIEAKVDKLFTSRSSTPWTQKCTISTRLRNIGSLTTTRFTLSTWKAHRRITSSSTKRPVAALAVSTRSQGVHQRSHPHQGLISYSRIIRPITAS